jgi:hypothetical protein
MTQDPNDDANFTVASGETVTVSLQSVQCNCNTSAGFDGQPLVKQHSIPDIYSFTVAGASGDERLFVSSCQFLPGDPVTAHYTIGVAGSQGGAFTSSPVFMETPNASFQLHFTIA